MKLLRRVAALLLTARRTVPHLFVNLKSGENVNNGVDKCETRQLPLAVETCLDRGRS
jgi:hypothetical protein